MKKIIAVLLATALLFGSFQYAEAVPAAEDHVQLIQRGEFPVRHEGSGIALFSASGQIKAEVRNVLKNAMDNLQVHVDLSKYRLVLNEVRECFRQVVNENPRFFYVNNSYGYYPAADGTVSAIDIRYLGTEEQIQKQKQTYESEISGILSNVDDSWNDMQKILYVHDYIAQNYAYDLGYEIYDAYQFLTEKKGVCQAYTLLFVELMNRLSIPVSTADSEELNHIWNVVSLNGNWYHVDVTWDDPTNSPYEITDPKYDPDIPDYFGLASHSNLLRSDTGISQSGHSGWVTDHTCSDTTYDSYFWKSSKTPFVYGNGDWYYGDYDASSRSGKLYIYDFAGGQKKQISDLGKWSLPGNYFIPACFSGLDLYGEKIYYNDENKIFSYDLKTKTVETVLDPPQSGKVYGIRVDGNVLSYWMTESQSTGSSVTIAPGAVYTYELPKVEETKPTEETKPSENPKPSEETKPSENPKPSEETKPSEDPKPSEETKPSEDPKPSEETKPSQSPVVYGDADGNGRVEVSDAIGVLKFVVNLETFTADQENAADVNGDHRADVSDAILILKRIVNLIDHFDVEKSER